MTMPLQETKFMTGYVGPAAINAQTVALLQEAKTQPVVFSGLSVALERNLGAASQARAMRVEGKIRFLVNGLYDRHSRHEDCLLFSPEITKPSCPLRR